MNLSFRVTCATRLGVLDQNFRCDIFHLSNSSTTYNIPAKNGRLAILQIANNVLYVITTNVRCQKQNIKPRASFLVPFTLQCMQGASSAPHQASLLGVINVRCGKSKDINHRQTGDHAMMANVCVRAVFFIALHLSLWHARAFTAISMHATLHAPGESAREMLWPMVTFFSSMVDKSLHRFYYVSFPQSTGERRLLHAHCPIRDLGSAWDATTALLFWKNQQKWLLETDNEEEFQNCQQQLKDAVCTTLQVYNESYDSIIGSNDNDDGVSLSVDTLLEPPHIAHSGFVILTAIGALKLSLFSQGKIPPIDGLTRGILSRQCEDGAFQIQFETSDVFKRIEFFPGEAMVALMEAYVMDAPSVVDESTREAILLSMKKAFVFYSSYFRQDDVAENYNIWQAQAFARLFHVLHQSKDKEDRDLAFDVSHYVLELCHGIVDSRSWKELARGRSFYPNLSTVEIACGLDAIAQGIRVAIDTSQLTEAALFWNNAKNAETYLQFVQDQVPRDSSCFGGIGFGGIQVLEQRLDVTGHAISALTKIYEVNEKCSGCK